MALLQSAGSFYLYYKIFGMYLLSIIFGIVGVFVNRYAKNDKHTKETSISLSSIKCGTEMCHGFGNYSVNGSSYDIPIQYSAKDTISHNTVYYDPSNPSDGTINKIPTWVGYIFMGIGLLLLLAAIGLTIFSASVNSNTRAGMGAAFAGMNAISALAPRH